MTNRAMNITIEELLFIPHYPCPEYTFNVVSVNGAGVGEMSSVSAMLQAGELEKASVSTIELYTIMQYQCWKS